jgi:hypothetical protein
VTANQTRGTCFGFAVRSSLPFHYLRGGDGAPLDVFEGSETAALEGRLLYDWRLGGETPFHARLHENGHGYRLWIEHAGWFQIDPEGRAITVPDGEAIRREERIWGIPALLCFLARGDVPLHAAAVEVDGGAVLLAAPGTSGKTTLAAGFVRAGRRLLSEDLTCLRLAPVTAVVPGPAMLRLRRDVGESLEIPAAERLGLVDDRVHFALDGQERGDCAPVPLRAIVFLNPSVNGATSNGDFALSRVAEAEAVRNLFVLTFRLPESPDRARAFSAMVDLARSVPVWSVSYPLRLEDLDANVERIVRSV